MATGIRLSELARRVGRDKSFLSRMAKTGRIPRLADGSFDEAAVRTALMANFDPARSKPLRDGQRSTVRGQWSTKAGLQSPPLIKHEADAMDAVTLVRRVLEQGGVDAPGRVDFAMARTAESILKSRERELRLRRQRGELVDLAAVRGHVAKAFIGYRQAMQRIPVRHAAAIAAEVGCDAAALDKALTRAITAELEALSAPIM